MISPLIHPCHTFCRQEFVQSLLRVEPAPATILNAAMWENWLIVDGHAVDVYRTEIFVSTDLFSN